MSDLKWGVKKRRTERFEVDKLMEIFGNIPEIQTQENNVVPELNFLVHEEVSDKKGKELVPYDNFLVQEEILDKKVKELVSCDNFLVQEETRVKKGKELVPYDNFLVQEEIRVNKGKELVPYDNFPVQEEIRVKKGKQKVPYDNDEDWLEKTEGSKRKRRFMAPSDNKRKRQKKTEETVDDDDDNNAVVVVDDGPQPPPPMPQAFKNRIVELYGGEGVVISENLVMQKRIETSDCGDGLNRLSIPRGKIRCEFLQEGERERLPLPSRIIEPSLRQSEVKLSAWKLFDCLNGAWNNIRLRNEIAPGLIVQLWAVRVDGVLTFVLVDITPPDEKEMWIRKAMEAEAKAKAKAKANHHGGASCSRGSSSSSSEAEAA